MPTPHKNKTFATLLAFLLGGIGAHRFYLRGSFDKLGLLHVASIPVAGLVYGLMHDADWFFKVLPLIVSAIAGYIGALVIGTTPDEKWDAKYNAGSGKVSDTSWLVAVLLVLTTGFGATVVIGTMARLFDLLYTGGAYG
jgi:TM2 domain-containing membrane protein YozV